MVGLIIKLIATPVTILLCDMFLASVNYASIYQVIGVGLVLSLISHIMELAILRRGTLWINTIADFIAAFAVLYFSPLFLRNAAITFFGALVTAFLLGIAEYIQHIYLINTGRTRKREY